MVLSDLPNIVLFLPKIQDLQPTDPILVELIAHRLREIREAHSNTKEYVMHRTGLGISDYERRAKFPTLTSITRFCRLYDISLEEFFRGIDFPRSGK